jgi:hypothetical protein
VAPLAHARHHRLNATQRAEEIRLHGALEIRHRQFFHRAVHTDTGVIHEHVHASALCQHLRHAGLHGSIVIHIERQYR